MTRFFKLTLTAFTLAAMTLAGPSVAQDATPATEIVKATYGAWDIICSATPEETCVMRQFGKNADGDNVIDVRIRKLEGITAPDGKILPAAIQITTPLGTVLRLGVTVKVDAGEPRTGVFEICFLRGCVLRDPMSEAFLANLKAGKTAVMSFKLLRSGEMNVSILLKGFTKAFQAL